MDKPADPEEPREDALEIERSWNVNGTLPLDVLPPEAIERLRAGGDLTEAEWALVRSAALRQSGVTGTLLDAALSSGVFEERPSDGSTIAGPTRTRTFQWQWRAGDKSGHPTDRPLTYYELLSGRPDPHRDVLTGLRRTLNRLVGIVALAIPIALVLLGIATGQSGQTIALLGFGGLFVGLMLWYTIPRTPVD